MAMACPQLHLHLGLVVVLVDPGLRLLGGLPLLQLDAEEDAAAVEDAVQVVLHGHGGGSDSAGGRGSDS